MFIITFVHLKIDLPDFLNIMKHIILAVTLVTFTIAGTFAQTDTKATEILKQLSDKTKTFTAMDVDFSFTLLNKAKKLDETTEGNIKLKGDKYRINLSGQDIFCDGTTITNYKAETNEATLIKVSDLEAGAISPQSIFNIYEAGFKSKLKEEKTENGSAIAIIDLYPLDPKEKDYTIVRLEIDKTKLEMRKATVLGKNGTLYIYMIVKINTNPDFADSIFTFNKADYPGVEVIE